MRARSIAVLVTAWCALLTSGACQFMRDAGGPPSVHDRQVAMFRRNAGTPEDRLTPFPPHRIVANLYYVGTKTLASFLVATPEGHILINTNLEEGVPALRASVEQLGFDFEDIKILLASHAHFDHMQANPLVEQLTGAKVMVMAEDVPLLSSDSRMTPGGKTQPLDHTLRDGEEVSLGGTTLIARRTPGHTPGCTTWTMTVEEGGEEHRVVIIGSMGVNPNFQFVDNRDNPDIVDQYRRGFSVLRSLSPTIPLASHPAMYGMAEKYQRLGMGPNPFVDPDGYSTELDAVEALFLDVLAEQEREAASRR